MRRVAASRVYINEKEFHNNHVVELLHHSVVRHYPLREELPMTEWLGGTIILRGTEAFHIGKVLSPEEFSSYFSSETASTLSSSAELSAHDGGGNGHIQRL